MQQLSTGGGRIDIAYVSPLAHTYIPKTIHAFLSEEENKDIYFNFHQDISAANIDGLKKGIYDLIFGSADFHETEIQFVPILQEEMVAIVPNDHPLAEQSSLSSAVFAEYPVLGYDRESSLGQYTRDFFARKNISPNFICECPDEIGIACMVAQGFGIGLVADVKPIRMDNIAVLSLAPEDRFFHTVYMGYMRNQYQVPAVKRLIRFVQKQRYQGVEPVRFEP
jgi:DNA-binding transcriptional LysR family regulator